MKVSKVIRYILGYMLGFFLFVILIPYGLYRLSLACDPYLPVNFSVGIHWKVLISFPFFTIGIVFILWSNLYLFRTGKGGPADGFGVALSPRTEHLVISGPYRYTRNPMVFGALLFYLAMVIFLDSLSGLLVMICFTVFIVIYLKLTEERRLARDFKEEYFNYRQQVPMIFPKLYKKKQ